MHAGQTTTDRAAAEATAPQRDLARLIDGYLTTQLLYVAAKLAVADVLADRPRTGREVADAVGRTPTRSRACCAASCSRTSWRRTGTAASR